MTQQLGIFSIRANDSYLDELAKLIPAESVAGVLAIKNFMGDWGKTDPTLYLVPVVVGVIICIFVRGYMTSGALKNWNLPLLAISLIAFAIWAANILATPFAGEMWKLAAYAGLVLMSIIGPALYEGAGGRRIP